MRAADLGWLKNAGIGMVFAVSMVLIVALLIPTGILGALICGIWRAADALMAALGRGTASVPPRTGGAG